MDDVTARITVAVEAGDSLRRLGEVENGVKAVTAARNEDFQVAKQTASASADQTAKEKQSDEEIVRLLWEKAKAARAHNEELMKAGQYSQYSGLATGADSVAHLNKQLSGQEPILSEADKAAAAELKNIAKANEIVNLRIKERQNLTQQELAIERAAAQVELADYREKLATLKAYNAELELTAAGKERAAAIKMGASPETQLNLNNNFEDKMAAYITAQKEQAAAAANAAQASAAYRNAVAEVSDKVSNGIPRFQMFSRSLTLLNGVTSTIGVKISSVRTLLNAFAGGFGPLGLALAAITIGFKELMYYVEEGERNLKQLGEDISRIVSEMDAGYQRDMRRQQEDRPYIEKLDKIQQKGGGLNGEDLAQQLYFLRRINEAYGDQGAEIDKNTGKISNWDEVKDKYNLAAFDKDIGRREEYLSSLKKMQVKLTEAINDPDLWLSFKQNYGSVLGLSEDQTPQQALEQVMSRLREESENLAKVRRQKEEFEAYGTKKDREMGQSGATENELESFRIQEMRINGMEREAKLAEVTAKWEAQRAKYGKGVKKLIDEEMKLYDLQTEKQREEQRLSNLSDMYSKKNRVQATSQSNILWDSVEALRLESRRIIPNGAERDPQQDIARNSKSQTEILKAMLEKLNALVTKIEKFKKENNLSIASV